MTRQTRHTNENQGAAQLTLDFDAPEALREQRTSWFEDKQERRRQRLVDRAAREDAKAGGSQAAADRIANVIPLGQPILIGHHSEKSDRRRRGRMHDLYRRAHEAHEDAEELRRRADAVGSAGISADDPEAVTKLEDKVAQLEKARAVMKDANAFWNAFWKEHATLVGFDALHWREKADALRGMKLGGADVPFPGYALQNIGARIREAKRRIEELAAREEAPPQELSGQGFHVYEDRTENRLLIEFERVPAPERRELLKRAGFRWTPSRRAWTRQLTDAAWASARYLASRLADETV